MTVSQLRAFILENFTGSQPPVYVNGSYVVQVGSAEAGGQTFPIPSLQGKTFNLRRQGQGIIPINKWEILDAGGFRLITLGDVLVLGETFELDITDYRTTPGAGGGGFSLSGVRPISTSTALLAADQNKLIQIRSASTPITISLPELSTVPENSIWPFEMNITNLYKAKIQTQSLQNIYFRNASQTYLSIGPGESIEFLAGSDGWYVRNPVGNWDCIGKVAPGFRADLNDILLDGSLYFRAREPRLWDFAQTLGASLVDDNVWTIASISMSNPTRTIAYPNRGCFSRGDGSTTFRVPDFRGTALRGLKRGGGYTPLASTSDAQRSTNLEGNYQDDMFEAHLHTLFVDNGNTYSGEALSPTNFPVRRQGSGAGIGNSNYEYNIIGTSGFGPTLGLSGNGGGGIETRMENIGINWYIKS